MPEILTRHIEPLCKDILRESPILVLQGARQVGKSTLAQNLVDSKYSLVNLDDPDTRNFAQADPMGFLNQNEHSGLIIDEVQRAPELILALKATVDKNRQPGQFILTGSSNLLRTPGTADSLAGRHDAVILRPFSAGERLGLDAEDFVTWFKNLLDSPLPKIAQENVTSMVVEGGFPIPFYRTSSRMKVRWFHRYIDALSTHDAADIASSTFASHIRQLLEWFAGYPSTELIKSQLAEYIGIAQSTTYEYLDILQRMYLLDEIRPWGLNLGKRVIQRPKAGLVDTGLAAALVDFNAHKAHTAGGREYFGSLLEQFVAQELLKQREWSETYFQVYHFRERESEIDLVVELGDGSIIAIEVKASSSPGPKAGRHINALRDRIGNRLRAGVILYTGKFSYRTDAGNVLLPVSALWNHPRG